MVASSAHLQIQSRIKCLTGRIVKIGCEPKFDDLQNMKDFISQCISNEKLRAQNRSAFYDSNRHIALHQVAMDIDLILQTKNAPT